MSNPYWEQTFLLDHATSFIKDVEFICHENMICDCSGCKVFHETVLVAEEILNEGGA